MDEYESLKLIDVINGFDFIRKIEGSVLLEQVCILETMILLIMNSLM